MSAAFMAELSSTKFSVLSVDKNKSLDIFRDLSKKLAEKQTKDKYCSLDRYIDPAYRGGAMNEADYAEATHKLDLLEISVTGKGWNNSSFVNAKVSDYYQTLSKTTAHDWKLWHDNRHGSMDILNCRVIENDGQVLQLETCQDDIDNIPVWLSFVYDNTLKCWIVNNQFEDGGIGIDSNGYTIVMDFRDYFPKKQAKSFQNNNKI